MDLIWARDLKPGDRIIHPLTGAIVEVTGSEWVPDEVTAEFVQLEGERLALPYESLVQLAILEEDE